MITLFSNECKSISQKSYNRIIDQVPIHRIQCTCGCRGSLVRHGFYHRMIKSTAGTLRLKVLRLRCNTCGITHALLPLEVVPYSQVSLTCQIAILRYRISSPEMEQMRNANPDLDESCISRIRRKFRKHWAERLRAERLVVQMELRQLVKACFAAYGKQFLQIRAGINLPFYIPT